MKKLCLVFTAVIACAFFGAATAADDVATVYRKGCQGCHGADGGKPTGGSTPIKGQGAEDLALKLQGYMDGSYGGTQKKTMENVVKKYPGEVLKVLADYSATL